MRALRGSDRVLHTMAAEALCRDDGRKVGRLLREAANVKNPAGYRVRLLRVVERIGVIPDPADYFIVFTMTSDKNEDVCHAAAALIVRLDLNRNGCPARPNPDPAPADTAGIYIGEKENQ